MSSNSTKKNSPHRTARERLAEERRREEQARVRRRGLGIAAALVAVVGAGAGIAIALACGSSSKSSSAAASVTVPAYASGADGTEIVYGNPNAANTLDIYEDFRCPYCDRLERTDGATITKLADGGSYKIVYHLGTFLDNNLGGSGSHAALAAAGAALDESVAKFKAFHDVLYANQPEETDDAFAATGTLLSLARKVPGLSTPAFVRAVQDGTYKTWATKVSDAFNASGIQGTPTLKLNGRQLTLFDSSGNVISPTAFRQQVRQIIAAAKK
jgi:protein-disulfide isomerase